MYWNALYTVLKFNFLYLATYLSQIPKPYSTSRLSQIPMPRTPGEIIHLSDIIPTSKLLQCYENNACLHLITYCLGVQNVYYFHEEPSHFLRQRRSNCVLRALTVGLWPTMARIYKGIYMYNYGWFILYGRNQHNLVKQLPSIKEIFTKWRKEK